MPDSTDAPTSSEHRLKTGIAELDALLGGGLIPGTLCVVLGATGIGKTQLGVHFAHEGAAATQEGQTGIFFDLTSRGDSQSHREYARRLFGWDLRERSASDPVDLSSIWDPARARADYLHVFERSGRRVSIGDLEQDEWRRWKIELAQKLERAIAFFYGNFIFGVRRCVLDGVEPSERASDSFQFHMVDYVYHQILRKDSEWVARDLFRAQYRANEEQAKAHAYDAGSIACLLLCTSQEVMLDDLVSRPVDTGDVLTNANTIIHMGKTREGNRMARALHVSKHRGSACGDAIVPYEISERGLVF